MSTPDVTTHGQSIRADRMEYITTDDRVPERLRRLENAVASSGPVAIPIDTWHMPGTGTEPALVSPWKSYGWNGNAATSYEPSTGSFVPLSFQKDPFGRVLFRGFAMATAATAAGATIFTLPVGYRPTKTILFDTSVNGTTASRIDITPTGAITVSPAMTANTWITFDGLIFDTETVTTVLSGPVGPTGSTGPKGDKGDPSTVPGPVGPGGTIEAYQQPSMPASVNTGAIWIDTDEVPPVLPGLQSYTLAPARVATTGNINLSAPGATIDGVTMALGDYVLVWLQTSSIQNGTYIWNGAATAMTRTGEAAVGASLKSGTQIYVREGTLFGKRVFYLTAFATVNTDGISFGFPRGTILADQSIEGLEATYQTLTAGGFSNIQIHSDGRLAQLVYTPPVDCYWNLSGRIYMTKGDAAYTYVQPSIDISPADADGKTTYIEIMAGIYNGVITYYTGKPQQKYRLVAGTTYTATLRSFLQQGTLTSYRAAGYVGLWGQATTR